MSKSQRTKGAAGESDLSIVLEMMRNAKAHGLLDEVFCEFLRYQQAGDPVSVAAWSAQYDWDI